MDVVDCLLLKNRSMVVAFKTAVPQGRCSFVGPHCFPIEDFNVERKSIYLSGQILCFQTGSYGFELGLKFISGYDSD